MATGNLQSVSITQALAGGVDSPVRAGAPVGGPTPRIVSGKGCRVVDDQGRVYIDYLCAYGPVLLGHADSRITRAAEQALANGAVFGATHPQELALAERVRGFFPSMEQIRFVSTGTEACMSALRVARSFTRREKIVRFEGCYHGHSNEMVFSAGASSLSTPNLDCGVTPGVVDDVVILPYNNVAAVERAFAKFQRHIGAIIVEPIAANMGLCHPEPGFLQTLRELCSEQEALLIFDEVITGLRVGLGGAQQHYGVIPDITCIGKTLGGGLPIAAFGGRADVMAMLAPPGRVFVGGTFSGNPVCVAGAHAFLDVLEAAPDFYVNLAARTNRLAQGLQAILDRQGLGFSVVTCASMVDFMFRRGGPHRNLREAREADAGAYAAYYNAMLKRGILLPPSQMELMFVTAAHSDADIDQTLAVASEVLR